MLCTQCHTSNSIDYNFCRECGGKLTIPGGATSADPQAEQLLARAFSLLDQGLYQEAREAAVAALAIEPNGSSAHSVMGLAYEREGKIPEAIREYEAVLERNPQSTADRLKLEALRGARAGVTARSSWTPQRVALASAAAACVVVFGGGFLVVSQWPQPKMQSTVGSGASSGLRTANATLAPGSPQQIRPLLPTPPTPLGGTGQFPAPPTAVRTPTTPVMPTTGSARLTPGLRPSAPIGPLTLPGVADRQGNATAAGLAPAAIGEVVPLPQTPAVAPGGPTVPPGAPVAGAQPGPAPVAAPTAPVVGTSAAAHEGDGPNERPKREPLEPETGFIRIEPINGVPDARSVTGAVRSAPPTISLNFAATEGEGVTLGDAQRAQRNGQSARRSDPAEAGRHYRQALGLFEILVKRGGSGAKQAREGLEECKKALATLR